MTEQQFNVVANLLDLTGPERAAAQHVIFDNVVPDVATARTVERIRTADAAIRGVYVLHGAMEFRIVVGHRDTHRAPGSLKIEVGDIVRLVAHSTERWIPVRVTTLPKTPADYYEGIITEQLSPSSLYQAGNGARFSEDQVMTEAPRAASSWRPRHYAR